MIVAEKLANERMGGAAMECGHLLTIWVMGTALVRMQMESGICFHPGWEISQIQSPCTTNIAHIRTKDTATPESKALTRSKRVQRQRIDYTAGFSFAAAKG